MDMAYNANLIAALVMALLSGIYIGRGYKARSDAKLREASDVDKLQTQDAALGRSLRMVMERMQDQGRYTGSSFFQHTEWVVEAGPEDGATYQLQLRRVPAPQQGETA